MALLFLSSPESLGLLWKPRRPTALYIVVLHAFLGSRILLLSGYWFVDRPITKMHNWSFSWSKLYSALLLTESQWQKQASCFTRQCSNQVNVTIHLSWTSSALLGSFSGNCKHTLKHTLKIHPDVSWSFMSSILLWSNWSLAKVHSASSWTLFKGLLQLTSATHKSERWNSGDCWLCVGGRWIEG